jgi:hypothetical protein
MESLKPNSALSKIEFTIKEKISGLPVKVLNIAIINATIKNPIHM